MQHMCPLFFLAAAAHVHLISSTAPSAPLDLAIYRWNHTSVWVRWRPPAEPNGDLLSYNVALKSVVDCKSGRNGTVKATSRCVSWPAMVCWSQHDLPTEHSVFKVTVKATNGDKSGPLAVGVIDTKNTQAPEAPQGLRAVRVKSTNLRLQWSSPALLGKDAMHFTVEMKPSDPRTPSPRTLHIPMEEKVNYEYPITGLKPNSTYTMSVHLTGGTPGLKAFTTVTTDPSLGQDDDLDSDADTNLTFKELMHSIVNS